MKAIKGSSSLFRKSLSNAAWSSLDYTVVPLLWLLATPFLVASLGVDQYGIWMLVNAFVGFSGVAALGMGDTTIRLVAKYHASGDLSAIERVIRLTSAIYLVLGITLPLLTYLVAPFLIDTVFGVSPDNRDLAVVALRVGGIAIALRLMDIVPTAVLHGFQRFDLAAKVRIPTSILTMFLNVALAFLGYSIVGLIVGTIAVLALSIAAKAYVVRRILLPQLRFSTNGSKTSVSEVASFAFYSWLQGLGGILLGQVDKLLVASLIGTRSLTYYAVCVQLSQQIHSFLSQTLAFLLPLTTGKQEGGDEVGIRKIYFAATNLATIAAVGIGIPVFLLSHEILEVWMGRTFADESSELLRMFILVFTLLSTSIVPHYLMNATGYYRLNTTLALIGGVFVTVTSLYLIPVLGMLGAAVSRLLSLPISIAGRTVVHFKVLNDRRWFAAFPIFLPTVVLFAVLFVESSVIDGFSGAGKFVLVSAITVAGTAVVGALLLMINQEPAIASKEQSGHSRRSD